MQFEIYTLGDTHLYWDILNGIAMLFNNSDLVSGQNGMNLSFGAFTGAMVLLCVMIYKSVFQREIDIRTLLLPLFIYMILTVPKAKMIVNDVYNQEATQIVDNVPIGLALPASAFSGFSYLLTQLLEQVLTVIPENGTQALPKLTEEGFLTPLQVLNQIRYDDMNSAFPAFQQSVISLYNECLVGNENFNAQTYSQSTDSVEYLLEAATHSNGIVVLNMYLGGEMVQKTMGCADASGFIRESFKSYVNGTNDLTGLLNLSVGRNSFKDRLAKRLSTDHSYGKVSQVNGFNIYSAAQINEMVGRVTALNTDRAKTFISNVIFDPLVKTASLCAEKHLVFTLSQCTGWISANEQWKQSAALSGTSFLKNMKNGQNLLILVGFMLFPIMVFMLMLKGMGSAKLLAGYAAFMFSNFLWLPFATIINFYAQTEFEEALHILRLQNPDAILTLAQAPQMYDALTTKLAVANNALGMVPIFTTMLFGGMMWAMSAFAKSINPAEAGYNAKLNSKEIKSSAPMSLSSSLTKRDGYGPTHFQGVGSTSIKMENAVATTETQIQQITEKQSDILNRLAQISDRAGNSIQHQNTVSSGHKESTSSGKITEHVKGGSEVESYITSDSKDHQSNEVIKEDSVNVAQNKSVGTSYIGGGEVGGQFGAQLGSKGNRLKGTKLSANIAGGVSTAAQTHNNASLDVSRNQIGEATENPTEKRSSTSIDNLTVGTNNAKTNNGVEATYKTEGSSSYDFAAQRLNEKIQNDRTGSISLAEKQEAQRLTEQMRALTLSKSEIYNSILSTSVSDRDLAGLVNSLNPRSAQVIQGLEATDRLGQQNVENWEELKAMGRRNAELGGHIDPNVIEKVSIYFAASNSRSPEVALAAMNAVSGGGFADRFKEHASVLGMENSPESIRQRNEAIYAATAQINSKVLNDAERRASTSEQMAAFASNVLKKTDGAVGLSDQQLKKPVNDVVVDYESLNYEEQVAKIRETHEQNVKNILYKPLVYKNPYKGPLNNDGTLADPSIIEPENGKPTKTTKLEDDLQESVKRKDRNAIVETLTKENEAISGKDAERQAQAIREALLKENHPGKL